MKKFTQNESVSKALLAISLPILFAVITNSFWITIDLYFLAKVREEYICFVSYLLPFMIFSFSLLESIKVPITILVAKYYGANDKENLKKVEQGGIFFVAICCLIVILFSFFVYQFIVPLMNIASEDIRLQFTNYGLYFVLSLIPWLWRSYQLGVSSGFGLTKISYLSALIFLITKVIFLVAGHFFGFLTVTTIGASTLIAMIITVAYTALFMHKKNIIKVGFSFQMTFPKQAIKDMMSIAVPIILSHSTLMLESGTTLVFLNSYGTPVLGALGVLNRYRGFILYPAIAFSTGLSIFISQNYGAKMYHRIWQAVVWTIKASLIIYIPLVFISLLFAEDIIHLMIPDSPIVSSCAYSIILIEGLSYPFLIFGYLGQGGFEGLGRTYPNTVILLVVIVLGRIVPFALFLPQYGIASVKFILAWSHMIHFAEAIWFYFVVQKEFKNKECENLVWNMGSMPQVGCH